MGSYRLLVFCSLFVSFGVCYRPVSNLRDFILEFGKDFSLMGEEYRIQVGNTDFHIGLLLFNRELAKEMIVQMLAEGAKLSREVQDACRAAGVGRRTVNTAKSELKVKSVRKAKEWYWEL
jgi:hypothetical protein